MLITLVILYSLVTLVNARISFANKKSIVKYSGTSSNIYGKHRLISYVVDWEVPKKIKWDQMDHIAYAFAEPNESGKLESFSDDNLKSGK